MRRGEEEGGEMLKETVQGQLLELMEELGGNAAVKALPVVECLSRAVRLARGILLHTVLTCLQGDEILRAFGLALLLELLGSDGG